MKLIKMENGFVNADMIESFAIIEHESCCAIVAYTPSYTTNSEYYVLGKCIIEGNAWAHLYTLAEWLTDGKEGIFDWESDIRS